MSPVLQSLYDFSSYTHTVRASAFIRIYAEIVILITFTMIANPFLWFLKRRSQTAVCYSNFSGSLSPAAIPQAVALLQQFRRQPVPAVSPEKTDPLQQLFKSRLEKIFHFRVLIGGDPGNDALMASGNCGKVAVTFGDQDEK